MHADHTHCRSHRRAFLADLGMGFTGLALGAMLHDASGAAPPARRVKAKSVIWLFMNGGVSHLESFDPKPMLAKYAGKTIAETPFKGTQDPDKLKLARVVVVNDANGQQRNRLLASQIGFKKRGKAGIEVSDWFPHIGARSEDIAFVRSMYTTDDNHNAQTQFHSGRHVLDGEFPTLGAWCHYGLGTLNKNLPQFISMGRREYWNAKDGHYLGPQHDAVPLRIDPTNPLDFGRPEKATSKAEQEINFGLVNRLDRMKAVEYPDDAALTARIKAYELAFRMQTSVPEALKFEDESVATKKLYGIDEPQTRAFGMQMLAARRLVEKGVRFIQVQHGGFGAGAWDAHGGLRANHSANALQVDKPIGGLLEDLKRRGLLDETIVLMASEFGRTPGTQGSDGRDHHIFGFSVWMAGGGVKGGVVHGSTDEIGFHAAEHRHYVTDIHATVLELLGLDSRKMEIPGRKRLDIDHGKAIRAIVA